MHPTTIAVDLAKSVFQVSIANQADRVVERKRLTRSQFKKFIVQQAPMLGCVSCMFMDFDRFNVLHFIKLCTIKVTAHLQVKPKISCYAKVLS